MAFLGVSSFLNGSFLNGLGMWPSSLQSSDAKSTFGQLASSKHSRSGSNDTPASECSTRCSEDSGSDSDVSPQKPLADVNAVILFDWDDTLFPTTWLRSHLGHPGRQLPGAELKAHAVLVVSALRAARAVAKVAIVTLAKPGWVTRTASEYLEMDILPLLVELDIEVHYARENDFAGDFKAGNFKTLKRNVMQGVLLDQCTQSSGCRVAVSIGDDKAERDAMRSLSGDRVFSEFTVRPLCKTLKLMSKPTLPQLSEELRRLTPLVEALATQQMYFDSNVITPKELTAINLHL